MVKFVGSFGVSMILINQAGEDLLSFCDLNQLSCTDEYLV